ncbi:DUF6350 family protein [Corynebacterium parakroppenstedtii]|uniref:cell division protein PerM n=1 Tax=Corynebacterium parakroppenstedtii TaxID=2828363 RepID=UPI001C8EB06A|nr:hypothetical protein [Corynebacterium parakroppenstedtii]
MRNTTPSNSRRPGDGRSRKNGRRSRGTDAQRLTWDSPSSSQQHRPDRSSRQSETGAERSSHQSSRPSFDDVAHRDSSRPRSTAGDSRANQAPRASEQYVREQRPQARATRGSRRTDEGRASRVRGAGDLDNTAAVGKKNAGARGTRGTRATSAGPDDVRRGSGNNRSAAGASPRRGRFGLNCWTQWWQRGGSAARSAAGGSFTTRLRKFLPGIAATHVSVIGVIIAVALIILLALDLSFVAAPATIASLWLTFNLAPLSMSGADLGLLPLLPAVGYALWIALRIRSVVRERISVSDVRMLVGCSLAVPILLTLTALAMLWDAQPVLAVNVPSVWMSVLSTFALNALAIIFGMGKRLWRALLRFYGMPQWPVDAFRLGMVFLAAMGGIGAFVVIVSLIAHWSAFADAYSIASGVGGKIGLTLLWIAYFPNMALASASVLAGAEANFGAAQVSLFTATRAELPPVPVLAAMPGDVFPAAWLGLFIPAAVAILVYRRFLSQRRVVVSPYGTVGVAALSAGIVGMVAAWLNSGVVGAYGWSGPNPWLTGAVAAGWMFAVGVITMAVIGIRRGRSASPRAASASDRGGMREADVARGDRHDAEQDSASESRDDDKPAAQRAESAEDESAGDEPDADDESNVGNKADADDESVDGDSVDGDSVDGDSVDGDEGGSEDSDEKNTADGKVKGESSHGGARETEADEVKETEPEADTTALATEAEQSESADSETTKTENDSEPSAGTSAGGSSQDNTSHDGTSQGGTTDDPR